MAVGVRRHVLAGIAGVCGLALMWSLGPDPVVARADEATPAPVAPSSGATAKPSKTDGTLPVGGDGLVALSGVLSRPDQISAAVTARATGKPVEVLGQRSETSRQFVLPDGRMYAETSGAPVQFKDPSATTTSGWRRVDTRLVKDSSGIHPVAVPGAVSLGTGTTDVVSDIEADGTGARFGLEGVSLPAPTLSGSTATYKDVVAGVDLEVEVRPAGFEVSWLVRDAAGAKALVDKYTSGGSVVLPTVVSGVGLEPQAASGGVDLVDGAKKVRGRIGEPVMWDATGAATGVQKPVAVSLSVKKTSTLAPRSAKAKTVTRAGVNVGAQRAWLTDPARTFPITIDPTYAIAKAWPVFDTYVQNGVTSDVSTSSELKLGDNGSNQDARIFMNFDAAAFKGRTITSANLSLLETYSWSCQARGWSAYDAGLASASTRWTAQPSIGVKRATSTQTNGYSASECAAGRVGIDMTAQAKAWSSTSAAKVGMMLRADDETDPYGWKRFYSNDSNYAPVMGIYYNRAPGTPNKPALSKSSVHDGKTYLAYNDPVVSTPLPSDADGNTVRLDFYTFASAGATTSSGYLCSTGYGTSGATGSCDSKTFADNTHTWIRARAFDAMDYSGWSAPLEIYTTLSSPPAPTISCPSAAGSWTDDVRAAETCTVTLTGTAAASYSAPTTLRYTVDGGATQFMTVTQPTASTPTKVSIKIGGTVGLHRMTAIAQSPVGRQSSAAEYHFGYGAPSLSSPVAGQTTTDTLAVAAAGPPPGGASLTGTVQWRLSGGSDAAWTDAPAVNTFTTKTSGGTASLSGLLNTTSLVGLKDASGAGPIAERTPASIDVRSCFTYTPGGTRCTGARTVVRVPHAFGSGFPVADAGPGQVGLWTGEVSVSESDADLPAANASISVSRTHNSFAGDTSPAAQVFGPGWVAGFDGGDGDDDDAGLSTAHVYDSTADDGTIALVTADGDALVYTAGARRAGAALRSGVYQPADDDTATSGITLKVSADAKPVLALTADDGTITRFTATATPVAGTATGFSATDVTDPATPGAVTYQRDTAGRVTAVIAPLPVGVTSCVPGTRTAGCRVLRVSYNSDGLVAQISAQVDTAADTVLSTYTYNTDHTMASQTDAVTGLTTKYTWTGKDSDKSLRLASVTPPGQDAYQFTYAANRLAKVTRTLPSTVAGTDRTAQLAAFVYNAGTDVSDFNLAQFDDYQLPRTATRVFAVFGPDQKIDAAPAAGDAAWHRASVYLTDDEGYTIHQGDYGAGAWQLTAAVYDDHANVIQSWDARATQMLRDKQLSDIDAASTATDYNPDWTNAAGTVVTAAGTLPVSVTGPARWATDAAGALVWTRPVTTTVYDLGDHAKINPTTSQPYRLTTATTVSTQVDGTGGWTTHDTLTSTLTGYDLATSDGAKTGWDLGQPTSVTTDMDTSGTLTAGDITRQSVYDSQGRVVEQRQPSATGKSADPGTRITRYYTAGNDVASCRKTEWIGLVCATGPGSGTATPTESTTNYTWDQQTATTVKSSGSTKVTTTTSFDAKMRPVTVTTTATGLAGSTPVPTVTTSYDGWGQVTGTTSTAGDTAVGYDTWGRRVSYTNHPAGQAADTANTVYDALGQVASVADNTGSAAYVYDGTDAEGHQETRGLVTKVTQSSGGQSWSATAAYDGAGQPVTEKLPGGITRLHSYDPAGQQTGLTYLGAGTDPETGAGVDDQVWFGWTSISDAVGRTSGEWSVDGGSAYQAGTATRTDRRYTYDGASRLTRVDDATLSTDSTATDADGTGAGASTGQVTSCARRGYGFDANGNRVWQSSATNTACASTGATTTTRAYDAADRPTTAAGGGTYVYDQLGRQTTIPANDTAHPSAGAMSLGYFDDDSAYSITQGTTAVSYVLDGAGRRSVQATSINGAVSSSLIRHYTDDSDDPSWTVASSGGTQTTSRYASLTGDGLGLVFTTVGGATTAQLQLAGPRGDINATATLTAGKTAPGIDSWADYTEYGTPQAGTANTQSSSTGITDAGYGWHGASERSTLEALGITLMGARLYNQTTGLFTSLDPQYQGGDTWYGYPTDPINQTDLDGNRWNWRRTARTVGRLAWKYKWDIALTALSFVPVAGGAAWAYRAYRLVRLVRAGRSSARATRATSWLAGRMWVGRAGKSGVAENGARMFSRGSGHNAKAWRGSAKKGGKYGYSSNITSSTRGYHTYKDFHVNHRSPSRWMPWR